MNERAFAGLHWLSTAFARLLLPSRAFGRALCSTVSTQASRTQPLCSIQCKVVDVNEDGVPQGSRMRALCPIQRRSCRCLRGLHTPGLQTVSAVPNSTQKLSMSTKMARPKPAGWERCVQLNIEITGAYEGGAPQASEV